MKSHPPNPTTTLAVILGSSDFPYISEFKQQPAFESSASEFVGYLLDPDGFQLPQENLLNLFNAKEPMSVQDNMLADFLDQQIKGRGANHVRPRDILTYYVGHGVFTDDGRNEFSLTLYDTRNGRISSTGYLTRALAKTLKEHARNLRMFWILDCCFAAAAYDVFQASPLTIAETQIKDELPTKGASLLCAANRNEPAVAPSGYKYTMFSSGFLHTLRTGVEELPEMLTFSDVGELTRNWIKKEFQDEAVRPEIHSPNQVEGEIAKIPLFPNVAHKKLSPALEESLQSPLRWVRKGAAIELADLLQSGNKHIALAASRSLEHMTNDDDESVSKLANMILESRDSQAPLFQLESFNKQAEQHSPEGTLRQYYLRQLVKEGTLNQFLDDYIVDSISEDLHKVFLVLSPLRYITHDLASYLIQIFVSDHPDIYSGRGTHTIIQNLNNSDHIEWFRETSARIMKKPLRRIMALVFIIQEQKRFSDIHREAADYYIKLITSGERGNRSVCIIEWIYHRFQFLHSQEVHNAVDEIKVDIEKWIEEYYYQRGEPLISELDVLYNQLKTDKELQDMLEGIEPGSFDLLLASLQEFGGDLMGVFPE